MSATSAYGRLPGTPAEKKALWATLLKAFPDEAFLTGGTNVTKSLQQQDGSATLVKAPEFVFHEAAKTKNATMVGFVPEQTNATDHAPQLENLLIAGRKGEWEAPLLAAMGVAGDDKGAVIFIAGGNSITRAINEAAEDASTPVVVVASKDLQARVKARKAGAEVITMGASAAVDLLARGALPKNSLIVRPGDALGAIVEQAGWLRRRRHKRHNVVVVVNGARSRRSRCCRR